MNIHIPNTNKPPHLSLKQTPCLNLNPKITHFLNHTQGRMLWIGHKCQVNLLFLLQCPNEILCDLCPLHAEDVTGQLSCVWLVHMRLLSRTHLCLPGFEQTDKPHSDQAHTDVHSRSYTLTHICTHSAKHAEGLATYHFTLPSYYEIKLHPCSISDKISVTFFSASDSKLLSHHSALFKSFC